MGAREVGKTDGVKNNQPENENGKHGQPVGDGPNAGMGCV
jgi:hypothetical protein